jgi:tetratricopeptide (TPR) repeat protein
MRSFIDKGHPVATQFYKIIEGKHGIEDIMPLIEIDPDFLDSYLYITEALLDQGHENEAELFAEKAFVRALGMILDIDGSWPDELLWGFHENRPIIKVLMRKADYEWRQGRTDNALTLYKNLLKTNLSDNIGARYAIVGIRNGLTYNKYMQQVWPDQMTLARNVEVWFKKHAPKCAEDLAEWKQYCIDEIGMTADELF